MARQLLPVRGSMKPWPATALLLRGNGPQSRWVADHGGALRVTQEETTVAAMINVPSELVHNGDRVGAAGVPVRTPQDGPDQVAVSREEPLPSALISFEDGGRHL
jgi:hypothetical protein